MARPTNKQRLIRLLRTMGNQREVPGATSLPLVEVRQVLGAGADSALLDLVIENRVHLDGGRWGVWGEDTHVVLDEG